MVGHAHAPDDAARTDPADTTPVDPTIDHWLRLDARLTTSGQPSEREPGEIAALGVRDVVNLTLHTHACALDDEAACIAALGIRYTHIPVTFDAPPEADVARFCAAMPAAGDAPMHVHCFVMMRVSAFVSRWRRDMMHWKDGAARGEMERIWLRGRVGARFPGDATGVAQQHRGPRRNDATP